VRLARYLIAILTIKGTGFHRHPFPPNNKLTQLLKAMIQSMAASMDNLTVYKIEQGRFNPCHFSEFPLSIGG
jgi:hypothetical protein